MKKTNRKNRPEETIPEIINVTAQNVEATGFFCYMSKKKSEGYKRKLSWLRDRFEEGLSIKLLKLPDRGFIEYIPGEYAWRAVNADGYLFIHCLWVVGKSKGKGFASLLLNECIAEAKRLKMKGVAMVTSEKVWLLDSRFLYKNGFDCVDTAPPAFSLMVKKFGKQTSPSFEGDWDKKAKSFDEGLTVIRSDQCPYIVDATDSAVKAAAKANINHSVVEMKSREDVLRLSPSPYGVFGLVLDGKLLSYHYQSDKDLFPVLKKQS